MTNPAIPADAYLDGVPLANAGQWRISPVEGRVLRTSSGGATREIIARQDPRLPPVRRKSRFVLTWPSIKDRQIPEELLGIPGEHQLVLWREEQLVYLGDGARTSWLLPNGWRLATDLISPLPSGLDPAKFVPRFKYGIAGAEIEAESTPSVTFDAGDPAPGEIWIRQAGSDIKTGDVVGAGTWIYGRVVPAYRVLKDAPEDKTLSRPVVEPESIRLVEI